MTGAQPHDDAAFTVMGWCPNALRPMMSGDGLVLRVQPPGGRLTRAQAKALAGLALRHGNGLIDLSSRGNIQLRGIDGADHPALLDHLRAQDLIAAADRAEAARIMTVTPFADSATDRLAASLWSALRRAPQLPGKFGFVVDTGMAPVMQHVPGDIRLERDAAGGIILRCDGAALGAPVDPNNAAEAALALARWFCAAGGVTEGRGRMAALIARGIHPDDGLRGTVAPAPAATPPEPGPVAQGLLVGIALGQMQAATLAALAQVGALRVTPWRMLLIEGAQRCPDLPGLILHKDDPLRRVVACTGAPGCHQALRPVRDLARRLAPQVPQGRLLHVSGCAKGCAHPGAADVTLVATARGFDLIRGGTAQDPVARCDLTTDEIEIGSHF